MPEKRKEIELSGKTLLLYLYIVRHPEVRSIRELQRALGFSSPSLVLYHLNKLRNMGLVDVDEHGNYVVVEKVKTGVLSFFTYIGYLVVPRHVFYASFYGTVLLLYLLLFQPSATVELFLLAIVCAFGLFTSLYECLSLLRYGLPRA